MPEPRHGNRSVLSAARVLALLLTVPFGWVKRSAGDSGIACRSRSCPTATA